jgi:hypothetical protein
MRFIFLSVLGALSMMGCTDSTKECGKKKIFVSENSNGNLGGVSGADAICNQDENKPECDVATYKALLVDDDNRVACTTANCSGGSSEHTDWVLAPNTQYHNILGGVVGTTNANGIFDFPLENKIDLSNDYIWTGMQGNWTPDSADANCLKWTSADNGISGRVGIRQELDDALLDDSTNTCDDTSAIALLCVEQ